MTDREKQVNAIWQAYPKKLDKQPGLKAIRSALKRVEYETLLKAVKAYSAIVSPYKDEPEKWLIVPYPQKWFNRDRWEAEAMAEARMRFPPLQRTYPEKSQIRWYTYVCVDCGHKFTTVHERGSDVEPRCSFGCEYQAQARNNAR